MKLNFISFSWFPFLTTIILHQRVTWSIRLRWLALVSFLSATLILKYTLSLTIPYEKIWWLLAALALINIVYYVISKRIKEYSFITELIILHIHIIVDLIFLTLILHYSGGMENPIYLFYVFHVVISSIIFPGLTPIIFATFVVLLFTSLIYMEYSKIIPHYYLFNSHLYESPVAIYLNIFVFTITIYVIAYICTSFMQIYRNIKRQIDEQNSQLIEVDRQKSQFFKFTSHELKAPIIAIKSSIDGLLKIHSTRLDKKSLDLLQRASTRATQMLEILKELLDLSRNRLLSERVREESVDVFLILEQVIQRESHLAEEKNLELKIHIPPLRAIIKGEVEDFEKIFANLLSNAIRYTAPNGIITITCKVEGKVLIICFQDSGIGIAAKDLDKIFSEFYRSENAKKMASFGTGLGLSLVKQKVEYYQGYVEVISKVNKGSTFTITIPHVEIENRKN